LRFEGDLAEGRRIPEACPGVQDIESDELILGIVLSNDAVRQFLGGHRGFPEDDTETIDLGNVSEAD
jgi:hypothetical protein